MSIDRTLEIARRVLVWNQNHSYLGKIEICGCGCGKVLVEVGIPKDAESVQCCRAEIDGDFDLEEINDLLDAAVEEVRVALKQDDAMDIMSKMRVQMELNRRVFGNPFQGMMHN